MRANVTRGRGWPRPISPPSVPRLSLARLALKRARPGSAEGLRSLHEGGDGLHGPVGELLGGSRGTEWSDRRLGGGGEDGPTVRRDRRHTVDPELVGSPDQRSGREQAATPPRVVGHSVRALSHHRSLYPAGPWTCAGSRLRCS